VLEHDELFGDLERGLDGTPGFSMGSVLGDGRRDSTAHKLGAEPRSHVSPTLSVPRSTMTQPTTRCGSPDWVFTSRTTSSATHIAGFTGDLL
jgi:hypothetical protein